MSTRRMKTPAAAGAVPQSKDACAAGIRQLGDLQRMFERQRTEMNDLIAHVTAQHQPILEELSDHIKTLQKGIQTWCESHRVDLCGEGDRLGKTANLVTGEVAWRQRPPRVNVRSEEVALDSLAKLGLHRFIRNQPTVNREAILCEPDAVRDVVGLTVVRGVEDFIITPFEAKAEVLQ